MLSSVLFKYRDVESLVANVDNLLNDLVLEMRNRMPYLLDVLCAVAIPESGKVSESLIPILASCYSILMKHKYNNLSAFHRLTSAIATDGGLSDRGQTRFNHLGLMLSSQRRLKLQESIGDISEKLIEENLKSDNLDIYIKRSKLTSESRNLDLHLFTSNAIFSRVATVDMNNDYPQVDTAALSYSDVLLKQDSLDRKRLVSAYETLLARILCQLPYFEKFKKLIPAHIPHEYSHKMAAVSKVFPLPLQFKNEAKHEDCLAIMDTYESQLIKLHQGAFGNLEILRKFRTPVGGDQLTRVRLQEAKNLRTLSVSPEKQLDDLFPIVCEMWHNKQDILEECFKWLFDQKFATSPGTLNYFKTVLHRSNVNGKVKGKFQPHFDLLMTVGEGLVKEQFMQFFHMETKYRKPTHIGMDCIEEKSSDEQNAAIYAVLNDFITHYGYCNVDNMSGEPAAVKRSVQYNIEMLSGNQCVLTPIHIKPKTDEVFNYCMQVCHWYLHILELNDTAKEGDLNRTVLNCKYSLPFFFSHSPLSKYLVENVDYLLKIEHFLSPLQRIRVLEGSYVNIHGGQGKNVESDLVQEHSVCNQKHLIRSLGANKSETSISRVTKSADVIFDICSKFDSSIDLKPKSARHSVIACENDDETVYKKLRTLRPFQHTPRRNCQGFENMNYTPLNAEELPKFKTRLDKIVKRLACGFKVIQEEDIIEDDFDDEFLPTI